MECGSTNLWINFHFSDLNSRLNLLSRFSSKAGWLFDVGGLRFEGHLYKFGEITCTHNLKCSAINDFPVILETSFKPLAIFINFALNINGTSLEWTSKNPGHRSSRGVMFVLCRTSTYTWSKLSLDNLSEEKYSFMIAILRTLTAGAKESWHTTALCFFGISTDLGDGVKISDLNLLIPSTFSFKAGSADLESSSKKQFLQLIGFLHVENPILHFFLCFVLYFLIH